MNIDIALIELGMTENYAPDTSTYEAMVATWRDSSIAIPSKANLQTAYDNGIGAINALSEINRLELLETPRRLAEALPDDAGGSSDGRAWLKANRDKIIAERGKL